MPSVFMPFRFWPEWAEPGWWAGLDVLWPQPQQSTVDSNRRSYWHSASCQFAPSCCHGSPLRMIAQVWCGAARTSRPDMSWHFAFGFSRNV